MFWKKKQNPAPQREDEPRAEKAPMRIARASKIYESPKQVERYEPPPGVVPSFAYDSIMAQDNTPYNWINDAGLYQVFFPGYPVLAQLALKPEFRKIVGVIAEEMTRKWINIKVHGDDESGERDQKVIEITQEFKRLKIQESFRKVLEDDGYFGRGQFYYDLDMPKGSGLVSDNPDELSNILTLNKFKVTKGSFRGLVNVEPMWTYPGIFNSTNPLRRDYYKPSEWYVFQKLTHHTRLGTIISNPVPDMLKASFAFGGISISQMCEPTINNWISTRDAINTMIRSFSTSGILTNMQSTLQGGTEDDLQGRAEIFAMLRDNNGVMLLDKDQEEFFQFNIPLSGLDALQAQSQEQMAGISSIPIVKLLGITPSGLNASSDGEIRVFYDYIMARQEADLRDEIEKTLKVVQLHLYGEIDDAIGFDFEPLYQLSELEKSEVEKNQADTLATLVTSQIIDGDSALSILQGDKNSRFAGIDLHAEFDTGVDDDDEQEEEGEPESEADRAAT